MSTAINGNFSSAFENPTRSSTVTAIASRPAPRGLSTDSDTVKLSLAAQISALQHEGVSSSQIASQLGVSLKQLDVLDPSLQTSAPSSTLRSTVTAGPAQHVSATAGQPVGVSAAPTSHEN